MSGDQRRAVGVAASAKTQEGEQVLLLGIQDSIIEALRDGAELDFAAESLFRITGLNLPRVRILYRPTTDELERLVRGMGAQEAPPRQ